MPKPEPEPFGLSPGGAARYLGISRATVYELLATGKLTARKSGSRTLVVFASLKAYCDALPPMVSGAPIANAPRRKREVARP
jgi:excisionase family DNA binding protein